MLLEELWLEDYLNMGMVVGNNPSIQPGVVFDYSHCWLIEIGNNVTIAPEAYLLAHDASSKRLIGFTRIGRVVVEDDVFIGARAIIMPNVTLGKGCIVAAGSVVTKSVTAGDVVAGNPAKVISRVETYINKCQDQLVESRKYDHSYTIRGNISSESKKQMVEELQNNNGFIR
ncbi:acyltransferase [Paenibacillus wynnii]|uniref:Acetyltransferase n=1 Tax=Paenibacillus wynnii TaxID=268407 RepID=A0A098MBA2_9BACL|nr:acyltransferase [Paenibacillus wynnii]KGE19328.1 hypothetical protein PWYN_08245 [Paenibacillus wynnii]